MDINSLKNSNSYNTHLLNTRSSNFDNNKESNVKYDNSNESKNDIFLQSNLYFN